MPQLRLADPLGAYNTGLRGGGEGEFPRMKKKGSDRRGRVTKIPSFMTDRRL